MLMFALDLEMNPSIKNPYYRIIEVGGIVGNIYTGDILEEFSYLVDPNEPLNTSNDNNLTNITDLTGITQEMINNDSISLDTAYYNLVSLRKKYINEGFTFHRNPITWSSDSEELKHELEDRYGFDFSRHSGKEEYVFGYRWFDCKTLFQSIQVSKRKGTKSGLRKAMSKYGLKFEGKPHRAKDDALNTFRLYLRLLEEIK